MEIEPEVARQQMEDTRASLTEKLETLEQHMVDTVQGATNAVANTVENVRGAVHDTVENVKDTLNLRLHVRQHPWRMVAGSAALGCLGGYLLYRIVPSAAPSQSSGSENHRRSAAATNGTVKAPRFVAEEPAERPVAEAPQPWSEPRWLSSARSQFEPEITRLKGFVIGRVLSAVRDTIIQSVSEQIRPDLTEVMDSIMVKLGGEPTKSPELNEGAGPTEGR